MVLHETVFTAGSLAVLDGCGGDVYGLLGDSTAARSFAEVDLDARGGCVGAYAAAQESAELGSDESGARTGFGGWFAAEDERAAMREFLEWVYRACVIANGRSCGAGDYRAEQIGGRGDVGGLDVFCRGSGEAGESVGWCFGGRDPFARRCAAAGDSTVSGFAIDRGNTGV